MADHDTTPVVLVVEDEHRLGKMLSEALRELGMRSVVSSTAEEGLRLLKESKFDALLMDLNLPAMDGMTMLERVREHHADLPVVILTAFGTLEVARRAIHLNVVDFLTKPCMLGDLDQAMARARRWREDRPSSSARSNRTNVGQPEINEDDDSGDETGDRLILQTPTTLANAEKKIVLDALERHHGNRSAAAAELGISRRTLYNWMKNTETNQRD